FCLKGSREQPWQMIFVTGVSISAPNPSAHARRVVITAENTFRELYRTLILSRVTSTGRPDPSVTITGRRDLASLESGGPAHLNFLVNPLKRSYSYQHSMVTSLGRFFRR